MPKSGLFKKIAVLSIGLSLPASAFVGGGMKGGHNIGLSYLAGSLGGFGYRVGALPTTLFSGPKGIARDGLGNIFILDAALSIVVKVSAATGTSSLFSGNPFLTGIANGTSATFGGPYGVKGIAADASGNVYVADALNYSIRKISPSGSASTLSGGAYGYAVGAGTVTKFTGITAMAIDPTGGNLYVADSGNEVIYKINASSGASSLFAGEPGVAGGANGTLPTTSTIFNVQGIAVDNAYVYVTDSSFHVVRKIPITPGPVTTIAGVSGTPGTTNGQGAGAFFSYPGAISIDSSSNLYVMDGALGAGISTEVRKIDAFGNVTTLAGSPGGRGSADGAGANAQFQNLTGNGFVDAFGNLYVADGTGPTIRVVSPAGLSSTYAGSPPGANALSGTAGLVADSAGNVYAPAASGQAIIKITPAGSIIPFVGTFDVGGATCSTGGTGTSSSIGAVTAMTIDSSDNIYFTDSLCSPSSNNTNYIGIIKKVTPAGVVTVAATAAIKSGRATGLARDSASGNFYVASNNGSSVILKITPSPSASTVTVLVATGLSGTWGNIAINAAGTSLFYADAGNHYIAKIATASGAITTFAGLSGTAGFVAGTGSAARFINPASLAIDSSDNLYVADSGSSAGVASYAVVKITPAGAVSGPLVGTPGINGFLLGLLPGSLLSPSDIAYRKGRLYIGNTGAIVSCLAP